ncbi:MAG: acyltransferase family protein [Solirubrobacteraceae bacterium]
MDRLQRAREPFRAGDPLRGIAALAVVLGHMLGIPVISYTRDFALDGSAVTGAFGPVGDVVTSGGTIGVSIFFVLSSYLLSRPFLRSWIHGSPRPGLGRYARNRFLRIVPAYWALLVVLLVTVVATGLADATLRQVVKLFVFGGDPNRPFPLWVGHVWTLDIEVRFYLLLGVLGTLFALAGPWARERSTPGARVAVVAVVTVGLTAWSFWGHPSRASFDAYGFEANAGRFSVGVLLALAEVWLLRVPRSRSLAVALFAGGLVALTALSVADQDPSLPLGDATPWLLALAAGTTVAGPLLWQWAAGAPWRALDNGFLRWAGSRSYSIYLVHLPVFAFLVEIDDGASYQRRAVLCAVTGLPFVLAAAELLHRAVERPAMARRAPSQVVAP